MKQARPLCSSLPWIPHLPAELILRTCRAKKGGRICKEDGRLRSTRNRDKRARTGSSQVAESSGGSKTPRARANYSHEENGRAPEAPSRVGNVYRHQTRTQDAAHSSETENERDFGTNVEREHQCQREQVAYRASEAAVGRGYCRLPTRPKADAPCTAPGLIPIILQAPGSLASDCKEQCKRQSHAREISSSEQCYSALSCGIALAPGRQHHPATAGAWCL